MLAETINEWNNLIVGGIAGGGLTLIMLRGLFHLLARWKDLVVTYEGQNKTLQKENSNLHALIDDQRKLLDEANHQILIYERENSILNRRVEQMAVEIIDLKAEFVRVAKMIGYNDGQISPAP